MNQHCSAFLLAIAVALLASSSDAAIINEFFANDSGGDTNEFIEIFGQPGESLDGLSLVIIDNDNGGNTASSAYRRVNRQYDFVAVSIPADGYFVLGGGPELAGIADFPITIGSLQNGSQTYALVQTADIAYDGSDIDELTQASIDAIGANAVDIIAVSDETPGELFDFGPILSSPLGVDAASRLPNGLDTDAASDWRAFSVAARGIELGDPDSTFATPGGENNIPEPASALLVLVGLFALGGRVHNAPYFVDG